MNKTLVIVHHGGCGRRNSTAALAHGQWRYAEATVVLQSSQVYVINALKDVHRIGSGTGLRLGTFDHAAFCGRASRRVVETCVPTAVERFFRGLIAEVRAYNRPLSPSEILELYRR